MNSQQCFELEFFGLSGKTALITGAASGIGKATARLFASVGARVVIADINFEGAQALADELGGDAMAVHIDIADEASVKAAFGAIHASLGPVEVCINNAAYRPKAEFLAMPPEEWDRMFAVIARGTFLCMRNAVQDMIDTGRGGAIVNLSSATTVIPIGLGNVHYEAAKTAVEGMTRAAAAAYGGHGIRVNVIRPGATDTEGVASLTTSASSGAPSKFATRTPVGRKAQPVELARAILFMASPAASYITGQSLSVDGGFSVG